MNDVNINSQNTQKPNLTKKQSLKLAKDIEKSLKCYRNNLKMIYSDAPIGILCLPKNLEKILLENGIDRIYALFDCDFAKIKGLGDVRIGHLTSRLNEFLSMGL